MFNFLCMSEFISKIQKRGAAVLEMRGQSSAFSAARAIVDHMRDWIFGTPVVFSFSLLFLVPFPYLVFLALKGQVVN